MTIEKFYKLPEDAGAVYHELRHGELISVSRPKLKHIQIQKRLERLLEGAAGESGVVVMELSFRPVPEYELRVAVLAMYRANVGMGQIRKRTFRRAGSGY
jgi:hypothetical protein